MKEIKCYTPTGFGAYAEQLGTLRASGGDVGGGRDANFILYTDTVGAICARDFKGVGSQYVDEGKLVIGVRRDNS